MSTTPIHFHGSRMLTAGPLSPILTEDQVYEAY